MNTIDICTPIFNLQDTWLDRFDSELSEFDKTTASVAIKEKALALCQRVLQLRGAGTSPFALEAEVKSSVMQLDTVAKDVFALYVKEKQGLSTTFSRLSDKITSIQPSNLFETSLHVVEGAGIGALAEKCLVKKASVKATNQAVQAFNFAVAAPENRSIQMAVKARENAEKVAARSMKNKGLKGALIGAGIAVGLEAIGSFLEPNSPKQGSNFFETTLNVVEGATLGSLIEGNLVAGASARATHQATEARKTSLQAWEKGLEGWSKYLDAQKNIDPSNKCIPIETSRAKADKLLEASKIAHETADKARTTADSLATRAMKNRGIKGTLIGAGVVLGVKAIDALLNPDSSLLGSISDLPEHLPKKTLEIAGGIAGIAPTPVRTLSLPLKMGDSYLHTESDKNVWRNMLIEITTGEAAVMGGTILLGGLPARVAMLTSVVAEVVDRHMLPTWQEISERGRRESSSRVSLTEALAQGNCPLPESETIAIVKLSLQALALPARTIGLVVNTTQKALEQRDQEIESERRERNKELIRAQGQPRHAGFLQRPVPPGIDE